MPTRPRTVSTLAPVELVLKNHHMTPAMNGTTSSPPGASQPPKPHPNPDVTCTLVANQ